MLVGLSLRIGGFFTSLLLSAGLFGCSHKIGDSCTTALDCSQLGDRLCDATQPGGYCTLFNCEPDTCPGSDSACVGFEYRLDPDCAETARWPRFERSFCMAACDGNGDCRSGYACVAPEERRARIVDGHPAAHRICVAASYQAPPTPVSSSEPGVCGPSHAAFDWPVYSSQVGASSQGAGGAGGSGGSTTGLAEQGSGGTGGA